MRRVGVHGCLVFVGRSVSGGSLLDGLIGVRSLLLFSSDELFEVAAILARLSPYPMRGISSRQRRLSITMRNQFDPGPFEYFDYSPFDYF